MSNNLRIPWYALKSIEEKLDSYKYLDVYHKKNEVWQREGGDLVATVNDAKVTLTTSTHTWLHLIDDTSRLKAWFPSPELFINAVGPYLSRLSTRYDVMIALIRYSEAPDIIAEVIDHYDATQLQTPRTPQKERPRGLHIVPPQ